MEIFVVNTGFFKLDGGAMFGVVPKTIWQKTNPANEKNLCSWAMRSMLVIDQGRVILMDTGMGDKQSAKFFSYYEPYGDDTLLSSLQSIGISPDDVTDVFLTHLHFDHCGGAIIRRADDSLLPTFRRATYWSNTDHWRWATHPNAREKASFLSENILPLEASGQLQFVNNPRFTDAINIRYASGHTEKMMIPHILYKGRTVCYVTDLLPSVGHLPLPYVMGYDTRPLLTLEEKKAFLEEAAENSYILFLLHDPVHECCTVKRNERGNVVLDRTFPWAEVG